MAEEGGILQEEVVSEARVSEGVGDLVVDEVMEETNSETKGNSQDDLGVLIGQVKMEVGGAEADVMVRETIMLHQLLQCEHIVG
jgi:hypothetical protein